jgi:hypothetical protein
MTELRPAPTSEAVLRAGNTESAYQYIDADGVGP